MHTYIQKPFSEKIRLIIITHIHIYMYTYRNFFRRDYSNHYHIHTSIHTETFFGEIGLIRACEEKNEQWDLSKLFQFGGNSQKQLRTATVKAVTDTTLLELAEEDACRLREYIYVCFRVYRMFKI